MSDLIKLLEKAKKEGLKGGQTGNPPPHAQSPCAIEVGYGVSAQKLFNTEKDRFLKSKVEISKKLHDLADEVDVIDQEASNLESVANLDDLV